MNKAIAIFVLLVLSACGEVEPFSLTQADIEWACNERKAREKNRADVFSVRFFFA